MKQYMFDAQGLTGIANQAYEKQLCALRLKGVITQEQVEEASKYQIVIQDDSYLGTLYRKLFKKGKVLEGLAVYSVKINEDD